MPLTSSFGDTSKILPLADKAGTFTCSFIKVPDANGCSQAQNVSTSLRVNENPSANFAVSPERTTILEPEINIMQSSVAAQSWYWEFGDKKPARGRIVEPHTNKDTGTYARKLVVANGTCFDSKGQRVVIEMPTLLYIPDASSPNGDGVNDVFGPKGDGIAKFEMRIFDRLVI